MTPAPKQTVGDLTPERLDALEKAAGKATPGPWASDPLGLGLLGDVSTLDGRVLAQVFQREARNHKDPASDNRRRNADAAYLALCDPATIQALVRAARRAEELEIMHKAWTDYFGTTQLSHAAARFTPARFTKEPPRG